MTELEASPNRETLLEIYQRAVMINRADMKFRSMISSGKLAIVYYPVRGQEVLSAAMMTALEPDDYLVTTYRGVHDQLAKGVPIKNLWAEFAGKATGTCKGKGGPMHITHPESGVMVTTGIVGSGLPIANGLAISSQLRGDGRVTVVCFGDGASNIGAFHEALNMASVSKLPVIFLCQNNLFAEHTAYSFGTSAKEIVDRATGYNMRGAQVNGNDPIAMYRVAKEAVDYARDGHGPTLVEAKTFRFSGHLLGDDSHYIPAEMMAAAKQADPMPAFRSYLLGLQVSEADLTQLESGIQTLVDEAAQFAMDSDYPDVIESRRDVLAEELP
ncbi:thiamine pyrophosphate-dependent dehydrogenase E1 component subunit alpha [Rhizorhapis sp. SPR117]|uniref:thiamine pyrophosphate-dependent dehydrogenase E1 component subunit alpha n=1 Tax=Rhizorhapis sp. SPR117 TaxID=2912611 RepID=UPI001F2E8937|nr:thiamine pyrophosphate-dependent dehydrogenase E1 component subunit alpha [Rhizorhapis sp. SPR117]